MTNVLILCGSSERRARAASPRNRGGLRSNLVTRWKCSGIRFGRIQCPIQDTNYSFEQSASLRCPWLTGFLSPTVVARRALFGRRSRYQINVVRLQDRKVVRLGNWRRSGFAPLVARRKVYLFHG